MYLYVSMFKIEDFLGPLSSSQSMERYFTSKSFQANDNFWTLIYNLYIEIQSVFFLFQSVIARGLLNNIADKANYVPYFINFSAQTSSKRTQEMIESKLEKKRKTVLGKLRLVQTCDPWGKMRTVCWNNVTLNWSCWSNMSALIQCHCDIDS